MAAPAPEATAPAAAPAEAPAAEPKKPPPPAWHTFSMQHVQKVTKHVQDARYTLPRRKEVARSAELKSHAHEVANNTYMGNHYKVAPRTPSTAVGVHTYEHASKDKTPMQSYVQAEQRRLQEGIAASSSPPPGLFQNREVASEGGDSILNEHFRELREAKQDAHEDAMAALEPEERRVTIPADSVMNQHASDQKKLIGTTKTVTHKHEVYRGVRPIAHTDAADSFFMNHVRKVTKPTEHPREILAKPPAQAYDGSDVSEGFSFLLGFQKKVKSRGDKVNHGREVRL